MGKITNTKTAAPAPVANTRLAGKIAPAVQAAPAASLASPATRRAVSGQASEILAASGAKPHAPHKAAVGRQAAPAVSQAPVVQAAPQAASPAPGSRVTIGGVLHVIGDDGQAYSLGGAQATPGKPGRKAKERSSADIRVTYFAQYAPDVLVTGAILDDVPGMFAADAGKLYTVVIVAEEGPMGWASARVIGETGAENVEAVAIMFAEALESIGRANPGDYLNDPAGDWLTIERVKSRNDKG